MSEPIDLPVTFGGVSIGDQTAKLAIKVDREFLNINAADEVLCGRRITGKVALGRSGDTPGQMVLVEDMDDVIVAKFDIQRFGVSRDAFTSGLTFRLADVDVRQLARFSKGAGRLIMIEISPILCDTADEDDEDDGQRTIDGTFTTDMPWWKVSLDELFSGTVLKALKGAGLATVGDMHDYQQPTNSGFVNQLADIKGLGPAKVQQVEDRMIEFWRDNPQE